MYQDDWGENITDLFEHGQYAVFKSWPTRIYEAYKNKVYNISNY